MSTLEAMASGGLVAGGFTGIGCLEYATAGTGLWAGEDDREARVEVLARPSP